MVEQAVRGGLEFYTRADPAADVLCSHDRVRGKPGCGAGRCQLYPQEAVGPLEDHGTPPARAGCRYNLKIGLVDGFPSIVSADCRECSSLQWRHWDVEHTHTQTFVDS